MIVLGIVTLQVVAAAAAEGRPVSQVSTGAPPDTIRYAQPMAVLRNPPHSVGPDGSH
jgi:hypothetical protein